MARTHFVVKSLAAAAVALLYLAPQAKAWSRAGHMVVGAIAYDELKANNPKTLEKLLTLLRGHPQWTTFSNRINSVAPEYRDRYLVMIAARWADDIRDEKEYHHPTWHYIDYPIVPPGEKVEVQPPDEENAITALTSQVAIIRNKDASPADRAVAMCWVEHIVGDLHQPMHTVSLFSSKLPKGDRGGNDVFVVVDPAKGTINLHALWDGLVTNTEKYSDAANLATELRLRPEFNRKRLPELNKPDPNAWVTESVEYAWNVAYLKGAIPTTGTKKNGALLPKDYARNAKAVAEKRTVEAGYRLADAIVSLLGK